MKSLKRVDGELIRRFVRAPEYLRLKQLAGSWLEEMNTFDVLSFFDETIDENSWTRIFAALFSSDERHGLGCDPFRTWLSLGSGKADEIEVILRIFRQKKNIGCAVTTEWRTPGGRRMDMRVELFEKNRATKAVVGIENKLGSPEGGDQIASYQRALARAYPGLPKLVCFLSPEGKVAKSSGEVPECPCLPFSYRSISRMCDMLLPTATGNSHILLSILRNHIDKLTREFVMESEAKSIIRKLNIDPAHREAMRLIARYTPDITTLFRELDKGVHDYFAKLTKRKAPLPLTAQSISTETWRRSQFRLIFDELSRITKRKDIQAWYVLHCPKTNPGIDDRFTLRLILWDGGLSGKSADGKARRRERIRNIVHFPGNHGHMPEGSNWVAIWAGRSHRLVDLGSEDVAGLKRLLLDGVRQTYLPLRRGLVKLARKRI
jgi:hypothetical protein